MNEVSEAVKIKMRVKRCGVTEETRRSLLISSGLSERTSEVWPKIFTMKISLYRGGHTDSPLPYGPYGNAGISLSRFLLNHLTLK